MRGSVLVTFEEIVDNRGDDSVQVSVNGQLRKIIYNDTTNQYSTFVNTGEEITISITLLAGTVDLKNITISRKDYTTDDNNGNFGIYETFVKGVTSTTSGTTSTTITATTRPDAYSFQYIINCGIGFTCFDSGTGMGTAGLPWVFDIEKDADNNFILGGLFGEYNGQSCDQLIRIDGIGRLATNFVLTPGTDAVSDLKIQSDGKVIVIVRDNIDFLLKRYNSDGTLDTTFTEQDIGTGGTTDREEVLSLQSDNKIIVGGQQKVINGKDGLWRFNSDGTIDTSWNPGGTGIQSGLPVRRVQDIHVYPDDKMLVSGQFGSYNGVACNSLIRLNADGTVDNTFIPDGSGEVIGNMIDVEVTSTGKILCGATGGGTNIYNGYTVGSLWRLNSDGSMDTTFPYNVITGDDSVYDIYVLPDDKMYIGGNRINNYSGYSVNNLFRLNSNGTLDTSFYFGGVTGGFDNGIVWDIEVADETTGDIIVGGDFRSYSGQTNNCILYVTNTGVSRKC
jgi:uncharacterized delta-60 repeat protein